MAIINIKKNQQYSNVLFKYNNNNNKSFLKERFDDLHEFNLATLERKRIIKQPGNTGPTPRTFHKSQMIEGYMYIIGGFDG